MPKKTNWKLEHKCIIKVPLIKKPWEADYFHLNFMADEGHKVQHLVFSTKGLNRQVQTQYQKSKEFIIHRRTFVAKMVENLKQGIHASREQPKRNWSLIFSYLVWLINRKPKYREIRCLSDILIESNWKTQAQNWWKYFMWIPFHPLSQKRLMK